MGFVTSFEAPAFLVLALYFCAALVGYAIFEGLAGRSFTAVLTVSSELHCVSLALLVVQVCNPGGAGAAGVSARGIVLEALSLCLRLSSTLWLSGYLPMDSSGDWAYQALDLCSLACAGYALQVVLGDKRKTYQEDKDSLMLLPLLIGSIVLGAALHADMDERPVFDALWMASLYMSAAAVVPQLALLGNTGGCLDPVTPHRIATAALGRVASLAFMWQAREDITCLQWLPGVNHAKWSVLIAHSVHLLLLAEFAYLFVKSEFRAVLSDKVLDRYGANYPKYQTPVAC